MRKITIPFFLAIIEGLNLLGMYVGHRKYMITLFPLPFFFFKHHLSRHMLVGVLCTEYFVVFICFLQNTSRCSVILHCRKLQVLLCIMKRDSSTRIIPCSSLLSEYLWKLYPQIHYLVTSTDMINWCLCKAGCQARWEIPIPFFFI